MSIYVFSKSRNRNKQCNNVQVKRQRRATDRCSVDIYQRKSRRRLSEKWSGRVHRYSDITQHGIRRSEKKKDRRRAAKLRDERVSKQLDSKLVFGPSVSHNDSVNLSTDQLHRKQVSLSTSWLNKDSSCYLKRWSRSFLLLLKYFSGSTIECCLVIIFYHDRPGVDYLIHLFERNSTPDGCYISCRK